MSKLPVIGGCILVIFLLFIQVKITNLEDELKIANNNITILQERNKVSESRYLACNTALDNQSKLIQEYSIKIEEAEATHTTDIKTVYDNYSVRKEVIDNKSDIEAIEYLISDFMLREQR